MLTKEHLAHQVAEGAIDTVIVAFTDMQGRLMGKRVDAEYFVETSYDGESTEGCNYLLTVDMEMDPVPGYEMASWERGYGDFEMRPDLRRCAASLGSRPRRWCCATSDGMTASRCVHRPGRSCEARSRKLASSASSPCSARSSSSTCSRRVTRRRSISTTAA